jgi:hypothetical protein
MAPYRRLATASLSVEPGYIGRSPITPVLVHTLLDSRCRSFYDMHIRYALGWFCIPSAAARRRCRIACVSTVDSSTYTLPSHIVSIEYTLALVLSLGSKAYTRGREFKFGHSHHEYDTTVIPGLWVWHCYWVGLCLLVCINFARHGRH